MTARSGMPSDRKPKGTVVETRIWEDFSFRHGTGADQFAQMKADWKGRRYSVRTHKRTVHAGGVNIPVMVAIVRDNDKPEGS